jgi:sulfate adenylyltransferase subunit 2
VPTRLRHLDFLESESIHIIREAVSSARNPVMLYSIGKDSSVLLHLLLKSFAPSTPQVPLLHIDSTWEFQDMYRFRDEIPERTGLRLIVHQNPLCIELGINPFDHGSAVHTDLWRTQGLKQALDAGKYDVIFGGARRDEEQSRAKERVFSVRNEQHHWDPRNQRPELWNLYNTNIMPNHSLRVFPLSNWTELDIWFYILRENIQIVPLYLAAERPTVERDQTLLMIDDDRFRLTDGESITKKMVRFRTLGCYPLSGAVESNAVSVKEIIQELLTASTSERQGRVIDHDSADSMERKRQEGYF